MDDNVDASACPIEAVTERLKVAMAGKSSESVSELLANAKELCGHGGWSDYVTVTLGKSVRWAQIQMRKCAFDKSARPNAHNQMRTTKSAQTKCACDCHPNGEHPCICALTAWEVVMAHQFGWIENKTFSEVMQILGKLSTEKLQSENAVSPNEDPQSQSDRKADNRAVIVAKLAQIPGVVVASAMPR